MNPCDAMHHPEENLLNELKHILYAAEEFAEATARDSSAITPNRAP